MSEVTEKDVEVVMLAAMEAFHGHVRKMGADRGKPYFDTHLVRVAVRGSSNLERALGYGHDLHEDFPYDFSVEKMVEKGFHPVIIDGIVALSRKAEETYFDFIVRIGQRWFTAPWIVNVKIYDLEDNMEGGKEGSMKDKYRFARHYLQQIKRTMPTAQSFNSKGNKT